MSQENLTQLLEQSIRSNWHRDALTDYFKTETFTYAQLAREIARLHVLFDELGLAPGDRVALVGRNNTRWCIAFLGAITYGAVIVPILQDFSSNDVQHIINHSGARVLFAGDQYWDVVDQDAVVGLEAAFSLTDFSHFFVRNPELSLQTELLYAQRYPEPLEPQDLDYYRPQADEMVVLNYTSGTTGFSKGVMLSAGNFVGNLVFARSIYRHFPGSRGLAFLPLAHAYGCTLDFLYPIVMGSHVTLLGKIPSPKILLEAMAKVRPHVIFTVPLVIEKIYRKQITPFLNNSLARFALRVPVLDAGLYALIRGRLMEAFGGEFSEIIIGGAPLNAEVEEFLRRIKFPFTVGYGMTECAPLISYTPREEFRPQSCGRVLQGFMEARIDSPDPQNVVGQVLVRGQNVMLGYYKNPTATAQALTPDGWLKTGDLGTIDPDQTLHLRGRSKSMILTPAGQNIYPEEIEAKLNNLFCVMESLVIQRNTNLVALVYPDYDQMDAGGTKNREVLGQIMADNLEELNSSLAAYEKVAEIILFPNEFEKTPKKSIKRYLYNV